MDLEQQSFDYKSFCSGTVAPIISKKEMEEIMKIVKSLAESGLLMKRVRETIKIEAKEEKGEFLSMILGTSGASLL